MGLFDVFKPSLGSLKLRLLLVELPKKLGDQADLERDINLTEQLISSLLSIKRPFVFEASVHHAGTAIHFYIAVPKEHISFAIQQIHALFPESRVEEVKDYTVFGKDSEVSCGYLTQKEKLFLPIRTYQESRVDTFGPILSNLSKLEEIGDGASLQILVRPATSDIKTKISLAINRLKQGEYLSELLKENIAMNVGKDLVGFNTRKEDLEGRARDEESINALERKLSKPLLDVNVRIITASVNHDRAEDILMGISGALSGLTAPKKNFFNVVKPKKIKDLIYHYTFRSFSESQSMILSTEELASIFHLPTETTEVHRIKWLDTKETAPPQKLSTEGVSIGYTHYRGASEEILIGKKDRRRHFYIIGQTGTGKTALMKYMSSQDISKGEGVCIIDPNGDFIDDILEIIPESRINDVIVFDPGNLNRPLGLNMLEYDINRPEEKTFIVGEMQSIFNRLFAQETMGPMFEQYMRNALLLLMDDASNNPPTLIEVPRVFTDKEFRDRKLSTTRNPVIVDFWTKEAEKAGGDASLKNITPYITSKFNNFIANDYIRPIVGQTKSAFNFREVMDNGKILLVKLAKGRIGDINANLLGMIITGKLLMAALSRSDIPEKDRKDFYFYIDEFQNFTTDSISVILSEARKYKLNLTIAHQFIAQLKEDIRESVFGNVGTIASFRVGVTDAEFLTKHFEPEFTVNDLVSIENLNGFIRLLVDGHPAKPFNYKIRFPDKGSPAVREKLVELSDLTYGKDLQEIENDIARRLRT